jgi:hypothetical protein
MITTSQANGHWSARGIRAQTVMKYLTTLAVAQQIGVSKQTLLNWLYDGKVAEPPRNKKGYRMWSPSRISLVRKMIDEGRFHRRTVIHRPVSSRPGLVAEFAREVSQFLRDAQLDAPAFLRELVRITPQLAPVVRIRERRRNIAAPRRETDAARGGASKARPANEAPSRPAVTNDAAAKPSATSARPARESDE